MSCIIVDIKIQNKLAVSKRLEVLDKSALFLLHKYSTGLKLTAETNKLTYSPGL
jgi:hypothetical protein